VISVCVLLFFTLIAFVFWLASLHDKPNWGEAKTAEATIRIGGEEAPPTHEDAGRLTWCWWCSARPPSTPTSDSWCAEGAAPAAEGRDQPGDDPRELAKVGDEIAHGKGLCTTVTPFGSKEATHRFRTSPASPTGPRREWPARPAP